MVLKTSHHTYPPLATSLPTAPLISISLASLESNDAATSAALYQASKDLGFFYLSMEGSKLGEAIVAEAEELHNVQKQFHALPNEEKEEYLREKIDPFFGYRVLGGFEQPDGSVGRNENYNVCLSVFLFLPYSPFSRHIIPVHFTIKSIFVMPLLPTAQAQGHVTISTTCSRAITLPQAIRK